jgi:molybdenum cofactor synthesis domain-containing protein
MKAVPVQEALGMVLCHDVTQIIPGEFKGPAFRKGHIVQAEDIPTLLNIGKERLYVWEIHNGLVHENDAAQRIAGAAAGQGVIRGQPKEGKVDLTAARDGLLKINTEALEAVNSVDQVVFSTLHSDQRITKGKTVAGTRVIPLVIDEKKIEEVERICRRHFPLVEVKPFRSLKAGIVTTGSEVYHGRIQDRFGPVVRKKLEDCGCLSMGQIFVSDRIKQIVEAIVSLIHEGAEMVLVTGGMSVDPDDVTPAAIRAAGGRVVTYGAPVLPGAMFMLAYLGKVPVMGLPGCVMYHQTSIFDVVLPRILAGEEMTRKDFVKLAHGGLCVQCEQCRYPDCGFGKGA